VTVRAARLRRAGRQTRGTGHRQHYTSGELDGVNRGACGRGTGNATLFKSTVTCSLCLDILAAGPTPCCIRDGEYVECEACERERLEQSSHEMTASCHRGGSSWGEPL
jgi:hypothetical protein